MVRVKEPIVHQNDPQLEIGKAIRIRDGSDVTLVGTGTILHNVLQAATLFDREGIHVRALSMHTIKPLDVDTVVEAGKKTGVIMTVEEHNIFGGLRSAVAEGLAESGNSHVLFKRISVEDSFLL